MFSEMKEEAKGVFQLLFWTLIIIVVLTVAITALNGTLYPWWLSLQRNAVENSDSFVDSNNNMLQQYILEHSRLDTKIAEAKGDETLIPAYKAQQKAIVERMCREIATMKRDTVNSNTITWVNSNGGCR
jgi:exoribonuclease II